MRLEKRWNNDGFISLSSKCTWKDREKKYFKSNGHIWKPSSIVTMKDEQKYVLFCACKGKERKYFSLLVMSKNCEIKLPLKINQKYVLIL